MTIHNQADPLKTLLDYIEHESGSGYLHDLVNLYREAGCPRPLAIGDVVSRAHQNSRDHGFWDGDENQNIPTKLMLIVSEAAEALEDYRVGKLGVSLADTYLEEDKPCGFPSELADIVIRVADLCGHLGIDLGEAILAKMAYNETRPHKHGNKRV